MKQHFPSLSASVCALLGAVFINLLSLIGIVMISFSKPLNPEKGMTRSMFRPTGMHHVLRGNQKQSIYEESVHISLFLSVWFAIDETI